MPKDSPEIELFKKLTFLQKDPDSPAPKNILEVTDEETVCNLYLWLLTSKENHGFDVREPEDIDGSFDKAFAIHAILGFLDQFERTLQDAKEDALVSNEVKLQEATVSKDDRGISRTHHRRHKGSRDARFPCTDREYASLTTILNLLEWRGEFPNIQSERIRNVASTIAQALMGNEDIPLDDLPTGETRPAKEVFCWARQAPNGGGRMTWFSDIHATKWLHHQLGIMHKMNEEKYPGFIVVSEFNRQLGRSDLKEDNVELKRLLIKTLDEKTPIPTAEGTIDPRKVIKWLRTGGGGGRHREEPLGPVLYAQADILEPWVRKNLICGVTKDHNEWIGDIKTVLKNLELPYRREKGSLCVLALNLILYDLWEHRRNEVSDRLGVFRSHVPSGFLGKIGIKGHFFIHPEAVGELVTRDMVLNKVEEIRDHIPKILIDLERKAESNHYAASPPGACASR